MISNQEFAQLGEDALVYMKQPAPRETGNLEDNGIVKAMPSPQVCIIMWIRLSRLICPIQMKFGLRLVGKERKIRIKNGGIMTVNLQ